MPRTVTCTLLWSPELQRYALFDRSTALDIIPDSPTWFDWLDQVSSFGFMTEQGRFTLRKEKRQRGDAYWYAYRSVGKRLSKKYVGKTGDLTLAHLTTSIAGHEPAAPALSSESKNPRAGVETEEQPAEEKQTVSPLLAPKLHIPRLPAKLVSRTRLLYVLDQQATGPLTLISAQAGAGKTTLVAEWITRHKTAAAWVSLEAEDNHPTRFLSYMIAALQKLDPRIGTTSLPPLQSLQPPALETILALLTNEIAESRAQPLTVVLDDYHLMTAGAIHNATLFLLDHLTSHLHLIILTRADPPLPLARLRGRGHILELRLDDLRFDGREANQFLQVMTDRTLSPEDAQLLHKRTEGWIAGLQFAALSLRGKQDISAFVHEFAGSNRFVLDYLSEEILAQLPTSTLTFLLHTCILERLTAPLCAALLDGEMGMSEPRCQEMLETLEKANLFVSALDDEQHSYRYHALFASVLEAHLVRTHPTLRPLLHQRACAWLEQHDQVPAAMHHALVIQDAARVSVLLQGIVWNMFLKGEFDVLLDWLDRLPDSLEYTQPALCLYHAMALACLGQTNAAETYLKYVESAGTSQGLLFPGESAVVRMVVAIVRGDLATARTASQQARAGLPEEQIFLRSTLVGSEAIMAAINGDFRLSLQYLWEAGQLLQHINNPFTLQRGLFGMALALMHLGQRSQVIALCEQGTRVAAAVKGASFPYSGNLFIFWGLALYENYELGSAEQSVWRGIELCERLGEPALLPLAYALLTQILYLKQLKTRQSTIPSQEVLQFMQRAETLLWQQPPTLFWSRQHAAYLLVRIWIVQRNQEALARLERFYPVKGEIGAAEGSSYIAQTETWGLAYIRLGQKRPAETAAWLRWPLQAAEQAGRNLALMRMLILQALAYQELGQMTEAIGNIKRALHYAEAEGYIAMFVEMGQPMVALLRPFLERAEASSGVSQAFVQTLLRALGAISEPAQPPSAGSTQGQFAVSIPEPLTDREREIVRLMGAGLSNQAIADRMIVEVSTVKWHIRHIYAKLQVHNRTQALLKAQACGLL